MPRLLAALAVAALAPVVAWVAWVSWSAGEPYEAQPALWFATVAAGTLTAGWVMPRRVLAGALVSVVAVVVTLTVLYRWWESQSTDGLFLAGIFFAAPLVTGAAPALVAVGSDLGQRLRGRVSRAARRPGAAAPGR